ncbi:hypothetical protein A2U01_0067409, partial [Trifolium medium]|nr:hypothetical protein [Trifolium medium]
CSDDDVLMYDVLMYE